MSDQPETMSHAEFNLEVEQIIKGYMDTGRTRLESIQSAIDGLENFLFEDGKYPEEDTFTYYLMMGLLWVKLAYAYQTELELPVAKA